MNKTFNKEIINFNLISYFHTKHLTLLCVYGSMKLIYFVSHIDQ